MKITQAEYKRREQEYFSAEYEITKHKPRGMYGNWAWHVIKKREFAALMKSQGYDVVPDDAER
jgi:hypothetical protein